MTFCSIDIIQRPSTLATTQEILRNLTREYLEETMQGGFLYIGLKICRKALRESPGTKIDTCSFKIVRNEMRVIIFIF